MNSSNQTQPSLSREASMKLLKEAIKKPEVVRLTTIECLRKGSFFGSKVVVIPGLRNLNYYGCYKTPARLHS